MQKENQQTVNENSLHLLFRLLFFAPRSLPLIASSAVNCLAAACCWPALLCSANDDASVDGRLIDLSRIVSQSVTVIVGYAFPFVFQVSATALSLFSLSLFLASFFWVLWLRLWS